MRFVNLEHRRIEPEIMDYSGLEAERHVTALQGLARLNWLSGSARSFWSIIRQHSPPVSRRLRILDVGCGGGDVLIGIARRARRAGVPVKLVGCDISSRAVRFAEDRATSSGVKAEFFVLDAIRERLPSNFDCIISSLFVHHLDDAQTVSVLRKMKASTLRLVVVSDLIRSARGLMLCKVATQLLTQSEVVRVDGPRSVRAALTVPEVSALAAEAGLDGAVVTRRWPYRFLLTWARPS